MTSKCLYELAAVLVKNYNFDRILTFSATAHCRQFLSKNKIFSQSRISSSSEAFLVLALSPSCHGALDHVIIITTHEVAFPPSPLLSCFLFNNVLNFLDYFWWHYSWLCLWQSVPETTLRPYNSEQNFTTWPPLHPTNIYPLLDVPKGYLISK